MSTAVIFDLEFWSDKGVKARQWGGPGQFRDLTEIGGVKFDTQTLDVVAEFERLSWPSKSNTITDYHLALTHRDILEFADAASVPEAIRQFFEFVGSDPAFCYGEDGRVILENFVLHEMGGSAANAGGKALSATLDKSAVCTEMENEIKLALYGAQAEIAHRLSGGVYHLFLEPQTSSDPRLSMRIKDIMPWFAAAGIDTNKINSGRLAAHLNLEPQSPEHNGLLDSKSIARAARHFIHRGHENIFDLFSQRPIPTFLPSRPLITAQNPGASAAVQPYRADR